MWLLNAETYRLEYFIGDKIPPYAILSHTWEAEEVSFQDIRDRPLEAAKLYGYRKIQYTCQQARKENLAYAWVDTCCIDKSSSAELSESINSMYGYYEMAEICYVYLSDVDGSRRNMTDEIADILVDPIPDIFEGLSHKRLVVPETDRQLFHTFTESRWFTRGWCLQELIAPKHIRFFDKHFKFMGHKSGLTRTLSRITGVDVHVLDEPRSIHDFCIARRMYWASNRVTTRAEDRAYSLMGIFDVNMPLLYGEGGEKAFIRLQQEIIKMSTDQSILAWDKYYQLNGTMNKLLADSPECFHNAGTMISWSSISIPQSFTLSNNGLLMKIPLMESAEEACAVLNCRFEEDFTGPICLRLNARNVKPERGSLAQHSDHFHYPNTTIGASRLVVKRLEDAQHAPVVNLVISSKHRYGIPREILSLAPMNSQLCPDEFVRLHFPIIDAWPGDRWSRETLVMRAASVYRAAGWAYVTFMGRGSASGVFCIVFSLVSVEFALFAHAEDITPQVRQFLSKSSHLETRSADFTVEYHGKPIRLRAQTSDPSLIMGTALRKIQITLCEGM